ncbi:MAG: sigma-54 interaction domain-containing protein, partial [bacterium]
FVTVNLPSIPKELVESTLFGHEKGAFTSAHKQHIGKFELAHNGILFLDEVAELPYDLQAKLLRALQEGEIERVGGSKVINVDVRIIAATNNDLKEAVKQGAFREDLYYRLNVIPIHLPPLRERAEDISQLADFFVKKYNRKFGKNIQGFTDAAVKVLVGCSWPGNIRELENLIERLVAITEKEIISPEDIPLEYYGSFLSNNDKNPKKELLKTACATFERNFILKTLEKMQWNRKKTADMLGIPMSTLKYKMTQLNIYQIIKERRDE